MLVSAVKERGVEGNFVGVGFMGLGFLESARAPPTAKLSHEPPPAFLLDFMILYA